jgi:hypothetical protein
MSVAVALAFSTALALIHWKADSIRDQGLVDRRKLEDFAAGVTVSYVFIELLSEINTGASLLGPAVFGLVLGGFSVLHVAEEYIYATQEDTRSNFRLLHTGFLTLYYFVIGVALEIVTATSLRDGILLFLIVALESGISSLAVGELDPKFLESAWAKLLISAAPVAGTALAFATSPGRELYFAVFAPVIGMFFYVAIHDSLKPDSRGNPISYVIGVAFFMATIGLLSLIL